MKKTQNTSLDVHMIHDGTRDVRFSVHWRGWIVSKHGPVFLTIQSPQLKHSSGRLSDMSSTRNSTDLKRSPFQRKSE